MLQIANPIYDVVFKYLMEDEAVAKLIISTIIGEEIESLTFLPQESSVFIEQRFLTVYRLDFSAKIKKADGTYKQILIEIQKAKFATDIMRFRRYLGEQYQDKANSYLATDDKGNTSRKGMPIITIYFLGYQLAHTTAPIIKVAREYYDLTTGKKIETQEEFIESLTHDSYVIQIAHLRPDHKSDVERLLAIFDQHQTTANDHILTINEAKYPKKYRKIVRRLQRAMSNHEMRQIMDAEDEIIEGLQIMERDLAQRDQLLWEKEQALTKKEQTIVAKEQELSEKEQTIVAKEQELSEKDRIIAELQKRLQSLT